MGYVFIFRLVPDAVFLFSFYLTSLAWGMLERKNKWKITLIILQLQLFFNSDPLEGIRKMCVFQ